MLSDKLSVITVHLLLLYITAAHDGHSSASLLQSAVSRLIELRSNNSVQCPDPRHQGATVKVLFRTTPLSYSLDYTFVSRAHRLVPACQLDRTSVFVLHCKRTFGCQTNKKEGKQTKVRQASV